MFIWATIVALVTSAFSYVTDPATIVRNAAELIGVIALFALVCAAEAFTGPKN